MILIRTLNPENSTICVDSTVEKPGQNQHFFSSPQNSHSWPFWAWSESGAARFACATSTASPPGWPPGRPARRRPPPTHPPPPPRPRSTTRRLERRSSSNAILSPYISWRDLLNSGTTPLLVFCWKLQFFTFY